MLASAAAHALAAATLGTALFFDAPPPRGDGNPVPAAMSVTVAAPPAPDLPLVAPPPDPVRKPPTPVQPPAAIAPRMIAVRATQAAVPAFTVPSPKPIFLAKAPLLPAADSAPVAPAVSGAAASSIAVSAGHVGASTGPTNGVVQTVAVMRARPDYDHNPPPRYPQTARQRGWCGTVLLGVEVLPDGSASAVDVVKSSGHKTLDEAATSAVQGWRFHPARVGDTPVRSRVEVPVSFRLKNG